LYILKLICFIVYFQASATDQKEDDQMNHLTNGNAKNGSSVHLLDAPVIVNTEDLEGTGSTINANRDDTRISLVQTSASASADISRHSKMNSPSHQRSYTDQRSYYTNTGVSIQFFSFYLKLS
jgi:hypothetical protein